MTVYTLSEVENQINTKEKPKMVKINETLYTPESIIEKVTLYDDRTHEIIREFKTQRKAEKFLRKYTKPAYYTITFKDLPSYPQTKASERKALNPEEKK